MVLQKVGSTLTEVLVNGVSEYGPSEQSDDSTYDVSVAPTVSTSNGIIMRIYDFDYSETTASVSDTVNIDYAGENTTNKVVVSYSADAYNDDGHIEVNGTKYYNDGTYDIDISDGTSISYSASSYENISDERNHIYWYIDIYGDYPTGYGVSTDSITQS